MARLPKRCLSCGAITRNGGRCPRCTSANQSERWGTDYQKLRPAVLERDGYVCQVHLPGCTTRATTVDHIDPDGPRADMENLQAACVHCNSAKRDGAYRG